MDQSYDPEERFNVFRFLSHLVQPQDVTHQAAFKAGPQKLFVLATQPPDKRSQHKSQNVIRAVAGIELPEIPGACFVSSVVKMNNEFLTAQFPAAWPVLP